MSVTFTYSTPTPASAGSAIWATAWTPDLSGIPESIITVAITINAGYTGTPDYPDVISLYDGASTDDGDHLDPVLDPGAGFVGNIELPIAAGLAPATYTRTLRIAKPAPGDQIRIDVEPATSAGAHVVTLYSISIVIDGEALSPCTPIAIEANYETTAAINATVEINEALADFSQMTPSLQAVIAFDGRWDAVDDLPPTAGSFQLLIDGVIVANIPIVGERGVVNPYSVTVPGIANPGPGALRVVALLVATVVGEDSSITADNVLVTITCEGEFSTPEGPVTLSSPPGLVVVRTSEPLQHLPLPSGPNYTATSLSVFLNTRLVGATASVYKTNRLRVNTNSFGLEGDIALVAADGVAIDTFRLPVGDAVDNLVGHMASVESGNSEAGTPTFEQIEVAGLTKEPDFTFWGSAVVTVPDMGGGHQLVGLRNAWDGPAASYHRRYGSNLNARLRSGFIVSGIQAGDATGMDIRNAPPSGTLLTHERFYAGAPFAIGPEDDLTVQVDNDLNKRYSINMWRKLKPATNVYGLQNVFKDADASNASLATTFGLNYPFNDFTLYMRARAIAFAADGSRRCLFRYYRVGPDGEFAQVRFSNPDAPSASVKVVTDNKNPKSNVRIKLASGAARTPSIRSTTRIGYSTTAVTNGVATLVFAVGFSTTQAQRVDISNQTRIRVQLPPAVTDCGLAADQVIFLNSTSGSFTTDSYVIASKDAATGPGGTQDIYVTDMTAGDVSVGSSIGTVSFDTLGETLFSGASIVAGDYLRIGSNTEVPLAWTGETFRITTVAAQYVICTSGEREFGSTFTNLTLAALNDPGNLKIFAASPQSVGAIATVVNAAAAEDNSKCPITMTLVSTGGGLVDRSTPEELTSQAWYVLTDGVNWASKTTSPLTTAGDYTLSFKKAINGALSTNADWLNEEVRLVPTSTANLVKWLNTPAVTGLYASCIIQASSDGAKLQIASRTPGTAGAVHVQGGLANSTVADVKGDTIDGGGRGLSTILRSLGQGLTSRMWVQIENSLSVPKIGIIHDFTELQSWTPDGVVTLNHGVFNTWLQPVNAKLAFEKQGDFVAVSLPGIDTEKFKVVNINRNSADGTYTTVLLIPDGLTSLGWQVGDFVTFDPFETREIVHAQSVLSGNYFFRILKTGGEQGIDYVVGDTFNATSNHLGFPSGTYTVAAGVTDAGNGSMIVECTNASPPGANVTVDYSIGFATKFESQFFSNTVKVLLIGDYNEINKTVTVTWKDTAPTDLNRDWLGFVNKDISWSSVLEGDLLRIVAPAGASPGWTDKQVPAQNQGIFRVVRIQQDADVPNRAGTIWIENPDVVEGVFESRAAAYDYHSVMPGDTLVVNTSLWGVENRGTWVVEKTGIENGSSEEQFVNPAKFKVSLTERAPRSVGNPGPLELQSSLIQIVEGKPARLVKKVEGIAPNQDDPSYVDIRWDTDLHLQQISAQAGSIVKALDKLDFSTDLAAGVDGYSYNIGLIGEANKVIYGDPSDTSSYPGVAAAGAQINVNGPLIKRLKLALQLRIRTGASTRDIANRVRSAVAALINQIGVGQPVAISAIINAASKVVGVVAVTMISPTFNTENDLISVQPFEKPLIVNLDQDIHIAFAGE